MQGVYGEAVCFPYTEYILRQNKSHFFQSADRRGKMTIADLTGRVEAKTILLSLNSNCPYGEEPVGHRQYRLFKMQQRKGKARESKKEYNHCYR